MRGVCVCAHPFTQMIGAAVRCGVYSSIRRLVVVVVVIASVLHIGVAPGIIPIAVPFGLIGRAVDAGALARMCLRCVCVCHTRVWCRWSTRVESLVSLACCSTRSAVWLCCAVCLLYGWGAASTFAEITRQTQPNPPRTHISEAPHTQSAELCCMR